MARPANAAAARRDTDEGLKKVAIKSVCVGGKSIDRLTERCHIPSVNTPATVEIGTLINRSAGIKCGAPHVAGTGITVRNIARLHQQGLTPEEIAISRYNLKLEQVHAALAYYFANRDEIEADIARQDQEISRIEAAQPPVRG
jgi:uncharacterized protein (DUF433 family)